MIALRSRFKLTREREATPVNGYVGRFEDWQTAKSQTLGYQDPAIARKVAGAVQKILSGSAPYERDSVIFENREFSFPLATALLWVATKAQGQLRVLDFGGGLGTSFFQNKPFMSWLSHIEWSIVEQPSFVEQARVLFANHSLKFYSSLTAGLQNAKPQFVLLSSSLQYVEKPYEVLTEVTEAKVDVIMLDRTLFSSESSDYVTRQYVPQSIFPATIPTWILSKEKFLEYMQQKYRLLSEFPAFKSTINLDRDGRNLQELGYLFVLKGSAYELALNEK
ncbi:methyltransferase, TIGR04325 family [Hylemonella gracilis]|nr:methyltransferase, TIGR04325 family [Hylemonella gracilis]